jgi:hypothetical protein
MEEKTPREILEEVLEQHRCKLFDVDNKEPVSRDVHSSVSGGLLVLFARLNKENKSAELSESVPSDTPSQEEHNLAPVDKIPYAQLQMDWLDVVQSQADILDPDKTYDWYGLAVGFALGRGLPVSSAIEFAISLSEKQLLEQGTT